MPLRVIKAVRALLDVLYLAQFPSHTRETLQYLEDSLSLFHQNKPVFFDLGVQEHFNIPKLHSLLHYQSLIILFGTTDNYNMEQTKRLHIDFAKEAFHATNHKNEYPQMTLSLECWEKVQQCSLAIKGRQASSDHNPVRVDTTVPIGPPHTGIHYLKMAQNPTFKAVSFDNLAKKYGAIVFQDTLADFIAQFNYPGASAASLRSQAANTLLPFRTVSIFHKIKFLSPSSDPNKPDIVDTIDTQPEYVDSCISKKSTNFFTSQLF
jgi:hypothetical protein